MKEELLSLKRLRVTLLLFYIVSFFLRDLRINIKPINNILDINVRFVSLVSPVSGKALFVLGFDFVFDFSFPFQRYVLSFLLLRC